ncbi:unnamed protein product, partial [Didymodactylos carnosus]
ISDCFHLLTITIELTAPHGLNFDLMKLNSFSCKLLIFFIYYSSHLSNMVLTLASIDRFLLIYCPIKSKRFCNIHTAKYFVLFFVIILIFINGHLLYGFTLIKISHFEKHYDCHISNKFYLKFYVFFDTYVETIFFCVIPFIIMTGCSIMIIIKILQTRRTVQYNSNRYYYYYYCCCFKTPTTICLSNGDSTTIKNTMQRKSNRRREKDIQLSFMLIGTSIAFILLTLPAEINDHFSLIQPHTCPYWFQKVLFILMQQTYYAGHFYIYLLTGQLFRKHLKHLLCGRNRRHSHHSSMNNTNKRTTVSDITQTDYRRCSEQQRMFIHHDQRLTERQRRSLPVKYL